MGGVLTISVRMPRGCLGTKLQGTLSLYEVHLTSDDLIKLMEADIIVFVMMEEGAGSLNSPHVSISR